MTKYNVFARRLSDAFHKASSEYAEALDNLTRAQNALHKAQLRGASDERYEGENAVRVQSAKAVLAEVSADFNADARRIWNEYRQSVKQLTGEITNAVNSDARANPADYDAAAMAIVNSGICSPDDLRELGARYATNATMLRLISKAAQNAADGEKDAGRAAAFRTVQLDYQNGIGDVLNAWRQLVDAANICSGQSHEKFGEAYDSGADPAYILSSNERFDAQLNDAIAGF